MTPPPRETGLQRRARAFIFIGIFALIVFFFLLLSISAVGLIASYVSRLSIHGAPDESGLEGLVVRELTGGARFFGRGATGEYSADAPAILFRVRITADVAYS